MTGPRHHTVRLFVAIELPEEWKRALVSLQDQLRRHAPPGVRWVRPDGAHLTLKFLGNVPPGDEPAIDAALREAIVEPPQLTLMLDGIGTFGRGAPRVLWVGLEGDLAALADLQQRIELALAPLGFPPEGRPFSPHLTLARLPDTMPASERHAVARALAQVRLPSTPPFHPREVSLMESRLRPGGAVYTRRAAYPCGPPSALRQAAP